MSSKEAGNNRVNRQCVTNHEEVIRLCEASTAQTCVYKIPAKKQDISVGK